MILLISAINFTLMPTSRNTWRVKAFLLRVDQKRIGVSLNRRVKIELAKTVEKALSNRIHNCHQCGLSMDRDQNAAINILRLGLQSVGITTVEAPVF